MDRMLKEVVRASGRDVGLTCVEEKGGRKVRQEVSRAVQFKESSGCAKKESLSQSRLSEEPHISWVQAALVSLLCSVLNCEQPVGSRDGQTLLQMEI